MTHSVIIPAFNEGPRVADVIKVARQARGTGEVLVIDDGSTDDTASRGRAAGARVISLPKNSGKGAAMAEGIKSSSGANVLFLDADLTGLRPDHIWHMVHPVAAGWSKMTVGRIMWPSEFAVHVSGQRATTRAVAMDAVSHGLSGSGYGADTMLWQAAHAKGPVHTVPLDGVFHVQKPLKWGASGMAQTLTMPFEILRRM